MSLVNAAHGQKIPTDDSNPDLGATQLSGSAKPESRVFLRGWGWWGRACFISNSGPLLANLPAMEMEQAGG